MGSTRLPGKVLADLGGEPLLTFLLERLRPLPTVATVVATSDLDRDDAVAEVAERAGATVVRGPEQDVLARYALALDRFPGAAHVLRITADCPLTDPEIVDAVVATHLDRQADYTSNVLPRTFPKGLDVEVATSAALRGAAAEATAEVEREHVMPYLYRHPERFRLANVRSGEDLGDERWTIDTPEDLEVVRRIVARLGGDRRFGWRDALGVVGTDRPEKTGQLRLRPATTEDRDRLLAWRNDADSVRFSLSGRAVTPAEHEQWLERRLDDPGTRLLIGEIDGDAVGMVRVDVEDAQGMVSIAVSPDHRGRGVGTTLLIRLVEELQGDPQVDALTAQVVETNHASRRAFAAAGFDDEGATDGVHQFRWENGDT
jgi:spore coat polysaccharide biosynthesis protein SpsF